MAGTGNDGSGNGHGGGNGRDLSEALLERIARAVENTNVRIDVLSGKVDVLTERVDGIEKRMDRGFTELKDELVQVNGRLDHMLKFTGTHHANHEQRISALEAEVFKKSG